jgi:hypothetical protein
MASDAFRAWWQRFASTGDICPLRLGWTRDEVRSVFGEPDDTSATQHGGEPLILKYERLELHFAPEEGLRLIYMDDAHGVVRISISRFAS